MCSVVGLQVCWPGSGSDVESDLESRVGRCAKADTASPPLDSTQKCTLRVSLELYWAVMSINSTYIEPWGFTSQSHAMPPWLVAVFQSRFPEHVVLHGSYHII